MSVFVSRLVATALTAISAIALIRSASAQDVVPGGASHSTAYTSIPQVFFGSAAASSVIRFSNVSGGPANFEVRVTGGQSGSDYTYNTPYRITVPDNASLQRTLEEIRAAILAEGGADIALKNGDTFVNLLVASDKAGAGAQFQHVTFASDSGSFQNTSVCTYDPAQNYSNKNNLLINVHTSRHIVFPSKVKIHNPDTTARSIRGVVYDAATGVSVGSFTVNPAPRATLVLDVAEIERQIDFKPTSSQPHVNIAFSAADNLTYSAIVAHDVEQISSGALFNLTNICPVNRTQTNSCAGPGGIAEDYTCAPLRAVPDTLPQRFAVGQATTIPLLTLTYNDYGGANTVLDDATGFADGNNVANGTFSVTPTGITYMPARAGSVSFTYRLRNAAGETSSAVASLTVQSVMGAEPDPIVAVPDTLLPNFFVGMTTEIPIYVLNRNDPNGGGATIFESITPFVDATGQTNGQWSTSRRNILYTPARPGTVTFTYKLRNALGQVSNAAQVTFPVSATPLKLTPVAANDTIFNVPRTSNEYIVNLTELTANDIYAEGATLTAVGTVYDLRGQQIGTSRLIDNKTIGLSISTANPAVGVFTYQISTSAGTSSPGEVTAHFAGPGRSLPIAVADTLVGNASTYVDYFRVNTQTNLMFTRLLANDTLSGATTITITPSGFRSASNGAVNGQYGVSADRVIYQPDRPGEVVFSYYLTNSVGRSREVLVRLTVAP